MDHTKIIKLLRQVETEQTCGVLEQALVQLNAMSTAEADVDIVTSMQAVVSLLYILQSDQTTPLETALDLSQWHTTFLSSFYGSQTCFTNLLQKLVRGDAQGAMLCIQSIISMPDLDAISGELQTISEFVSASPLFNSSPDDNSMLDELMQYRALLVQVRDNVSNEHVDCALGVLLGDQESLEKAAHNWLDLLIGMLLYAPTGTMNIDKAVANSVLKPSPEGDHPMMPIFQSIVTAKYDFTVKLSASILDCKWFPSFLCRFLGVEDRLKQACDMEYVKEFENDKAMWKFVVDLIPSPEYSNELLQYLLKAVNIVDPKELFGYCQMRKCDSVCRQALRMKGSALINNGGHQDAITLLSLSGDSDGVENAILCIFLSLSFPMTEDTKKTTAVTLQKIIQNLPNPSDSSLDMLKQFIQYLKTSSPEILKLFILDPKLPPKQRFGFIQESLSLINRTQSNKDELIAQTLLALELFDDGSIPSQQTSLVRFNLLQHSLIL